MHQGWSIKQGYELFSLLFHAEKRGKEEFLSPSPCVHIKVYEVCDNGCYVDEDGDDDPLYSITVPSVSRPGSQVTASLVSALLAP